MLHRFPRALQWPTLLSLLGLLTASVPVSAQHTLHVRVTDEHSGEPLPGASVVLEGTTLGAAAGPDGLATVTGVPDGEHTFVVSFVGFESAHLTFTFPLADPDAPVEVALGAAHEEVDEVVVGATRTSRTIAEVPTRVETIAGEEIDEKVSMDPSNISMILNESPGIVVQQTSAVSGNASIRIQGLDGRYTQLLKDGFPLYGGFSGGLSLLQVPPLDLRQVEVIKGPASTLYGGGAIAGLVNLVSKTPGADRNARSSSTPRARAASTPALSSSTAPSGSATPSSPRGTSSGPTTATATPSRTSPGHTASPWPRRGSTTRRTPRRCGSGSPAPSRSAKAAT